MTSVLLAGILGLHDKGEAYAIVLAVATATTFAATFVVRIVTHRLGLVVQPATRGVHQLPTATAGGAAMFVGLLAAMATASRLPAFEKAFTGSSEPLGVVLGASVIFTVGLLDDVTKVSRNPKRNGLRKDGVSAPAKVAGQVLAGTVLYFLGVTMFYFRIPFAGFVILSPDLAPLATVVWVAVIANAVNLVDGLDGLAAGIVGIAGLAFFLYGNRLSAVGLLAPDSIGPLVAIIVVGLCLGFLPHNVHPARIFMGDAGAMLLGLLMASSSLVVGGRIDNPFSGQTFFFLAPIFIPFFVLGVPIIDSVFAFLRRIVHRSGWSVADKEHIHHRLMRLGHGHRRSVVILWMWTAILAALVLFPTYSNKGNPLVLPGIAALGVAMYTVFHPGIRRARGGEEAEEPQVGLAAETPADVGIAIPAIPIRIEDTLPGGVTPIPIDRVGRRRS